MTELPDDPTAEDIDRLMTSRAAAFEQGWTLRAEEIDRQRRRRFTRTTLQFWFLFAFLLVSFVLLAYRTEVTARDLRTGLYEACQSRVHQAEQYNEGREALIQLVVHNPEKPIPPEKLDQTLKQLRDGLLLPVEDCGADPNA